MLSVSEYMYQRSDNEASFFKYKITGNHDAMNAQLTEIMRLIINLFRTGTVIDVDWRN